MGRNAPCFCGSNKKTKKCHPNIHKDSLAAKIIKSYNKIDETILKHQKDTGKKSKCHMGCSECCYHYFIITDCEFYIILNEINNWNNNEKEKLVKKTKQYMEIFEIAHPDIVNYFSQNHSGCKNEFIETNYLIDKTSFPCLFLDEKTQKCKVYNLRPKICRIHGNTMFITHNKETDYETLNSNICNNIGKYKDADWLINIEIIPGSEHDYKNIFIDSNKLISTKEYPIFYHLYDNLFLQQLNFKIPPDLNVKFFSISQDEFAKRIKYSLNIK